jgi:hypothetical protein
MTTNFPFLPTTPITAAMLAADCGGSIEGGLIAGVPGKICASPFLRNTP